SAGVFTPFLPGVRRGFPGAARTGDLTALEVDVDALGLTRRHFHLGRLGRESRPGDHDLVRSRRDLEPTGQAGQLVRRAREMVVDVDGRIARLDLEDEAAAARARGGDPLALRRGVVRRRVVVALARRRLLRRRLLVGGRAARAAAVAPFGLVVAVRIAV